MRTFYWFLYFFASLIRTVPKMNQLKHMSKNGQDAQSCSEARQLASKWAGDMLRVAGANVTVEGLENIPKGAYVLTPNHQGYFDIPVFLTNIPGDLSFFSKMEVKKIPFVSTWMELLHCVFVQRGDKSQSMRAMHDAVHTLKNGHPLVIFPEGTRSKGDVIGPFKSGAFHIARKAKVPIVPVCMDGTYKLMEGNRNRIRPAQIHFSILPPVDVASMDKEEFSHAAEYVRSLIVQEQQRIHMRQQQRISAQQLETI